VLGWAAFHGSSRIPVPSVLEVGNVLLTTSGRAAIALALQAVGLRPGDRVLVPSYHCPTMIAPVVNTGAEPVFFPVTKSGGPALSRIVREDLDRVRAMIVAHYFGIPQPLAEVRRFCDERKIALIEDCAHALFGTSGGQPIGTWGDFAIASLTKFLPVNEGGCLASRVHRLDGFMLSSRSLRDELQALADEVELGAQHGRFPGVNALLRAIFKAKDLVRRGSQRVPPNALADTPADESAYEYDVELVGARVTLAARLIARTTQRDRIVDRRQRNYALMASLLADLPGTSILQPTLPEGAVPYVFPLQVDDPESPYRAIREARVPVFRWDRLWPGTPILHGDEGRRWSTEIFQLGCHQDMSESDVRLVAQIVRQVMESTPR